MAQAQRSVLFTEAKISGGTIWRSDIFRAANGAIHEDGRDGQALERQPGLAVQGRVAHGDPDPKASGVAVFKDALS